MTIKAKAWDMAEHLKTQEDIAEYLTVALGNVARAQGMADIARETGLSRESL
ncbi:MAG: hypothetical protein K2Q10_14545 [Rhodospirillales bacterium]|nr:hypothetical protein [Rhodospirillales bacterium]